MVDSLTSEQYSDIKTALYYFEKQMQTIAADATKETLENAERIHSENHIDNLLSVFNKKKEVNPPYSEIINN